MQQEYLPFTLATDKISIRGVSWGNFGNTSLTHCVQSFLVVFLAHDQSAKPVPVDS